MEEAFSTPNLSGNSSFQQAKSPTARREGRPREHGMGLPPAQRYHLQPLPILGNSSTLDHAGLNMRVPQSVTHHGDSIIQERLAKHNDEEGLINVDLFKDSQDCHRVHS